MKSAVKNKAFTLTELLVAVVIIGVLSAVALPQFNRVIETRKTGEAEEMLSAIRSEQEKRCALDKPYASTFKQVGGVAAFADETAAQAGSANYTYTLEAKGVSAFSDKGYTLRILSYTDGRICCEGDYCSRLNKNYPSCDSFTPQEAQCQTDAPLLGCSGSTTQSCGCNGTGIQTRVCDTTTGTWGNWSGCSASDACDCAAVSGAKPADENRSCNGCGTQTASYTCDTSTGQWVLGNYGECDKTAAACENALCDNFGYFINHTSQCCTVVRTQTDNYYIAYPGADSSAHEDSCNADSLYGAYSCTTNDYVNKKTCNEYVLDTNSGSGPRRYPECSGGSSSSGKITGGYWNTTLKSGQRSASSTCHNISISSISGTGTGYPILPENAMAACEEHGYSGGNLGSDGYRGICTIYWPNNLYIGGEGMKYQYYESTLYCKWESSGETANNCTGGYHITVNRVNCCSNR